MTTDFDLKDLANETEAKYRELVLGLARGEEVNRQDLYEAAMLTGRSLAKVEEHRARIAARVEAIAILEAAGEKDQELERLAAATREAETNQKRVEAERQKALQQAAAVVTEAFNRWQRLVSERLRENKKAQEIIGETSDPAIGEAIANVADVTFRRRWFDERKDRLSACDQVHLRTALALLSSGRSNAEDAAAGQAEVEALRAVRMLAAEGMRWD
jgi:hypothetical protein